MTIELKKNINKICLDFAKKYEECIGNQTIGTCYLIGHCFYEAFKKAGYTANEVTGTLILKDKHCKNIIYGKSIIKGSNIGIYHTWCVVKIEGEEIIIDPSYKYNKIGFKGFQIKGNPKIPDFIITNQNNTWLHTYIADSTLSCHSKYYLNQVSKTLIAKIITDVTESISENLNRKTQLS